MLSKTAII